MPGNRLRSGKEIGQPVSFLYKAALTSALSAVRKQAPETMPIAALKVQMMERANR